MLSQADAGELTLNRESVAPLSLLERMVKSYQHLATQKSVSLEMQGEPGLPEISLDPDRMAQIFGNLFTNPLRYTPEGGKIVLSAVRERNLLAFCVKDKGQGISAEALPDIFDRLYRADPARTQGSESGRGLAIARSIVEAHGETITADSYVGQGTTVSINLPFP